MTVDATTVVIADDHVVTRRGVRAILETLDAVRVIGEAGDGVEAVRLCSELHPTVAFVDLQMPQMDGLHAIRLITQSCPNTRVIALTVEDDASVIMDVLQAGASGYLSKTSNADDLARAMRDPDPHGVYMSPAIATKLISSVANGYPAKGRRDPGEHEGLTPREHEVLVLLGEGMTSRRIARRLGISERTVDTHVSNMYRRLGVNNRVDAVLEGIRLGLVHAPVSA